MRGSWTGLALLTLTTVSVHAAAKPNGPTPATAVRIPREQVRKQGRGVHPDYHSLSAGIVLFGAAYALAIAEPLRHGFQGTSGKRAYPLAGPWFPSISWAWALDGVLQLGGAAFIGNAFVNPVIIVGTPVAAQSWPCAREGFVGLRGDF